MFLRIVILSISIILCPIAKSMDHNKGILAFGLGVTTLAVIGSKYFANKYKTVCIGDRPYEGPCTTDWAASKTWKVTDHRQKAIPIVSFHPETVSDPFLPIIQTISPSWLEFLTGNGKYKPIDNRVLTKLKQENFSGFIAALVHQQNTPDNSDQLHIFNLCNNDESKCIVKTWCKEDYSKIDYYTQKNELPRITEEHTQIPINSGNNYIFVTTSDAENHLENGSNQINRKGSSVMEKGVMLALKTLSSNVDTKTIILDNAIRSIVEKATDASDALETLHSIANQSKKTGHSGEKMLLHIEK